MGLQFSSTNRPPHASGDNTINDNVVTHQNNHPTAVIMQETNAQLAARAVMALGSIALCVYAIHKISDIDPNKQEKKVGKKAKAELIQRIQQRKADRLRSIKTQNITDPNELRRIEADLAREENRLISTSIHEEVLMQDIVFPDQIQVSFDDIGGLADIKNSLRRTVLLPFQNLLSDEKNDISALLAAPKGVLFYGPPGTGKSMMAKAIAKSVNASFLNLSPATIQSKWFGESLKYVRAVFSLAKKISPTIIFIDEIDCFLMQRGSFGEHETSVTIKAEFMTLWDGLLTEIAEDQRMNNQIMIIGATNRPQDIDEAILRRLARKFEFKLPDKESRLQILRVILKNEDTSAVSLEIVANLTEGYSGSDLKEVCRYAVLSGLETPDDKQLSANPNDRVVVSRRKLVTTDFAGALEVVKPSSKSKMQN